MRYEICGGTLPVVICRLEPGESMISESGSMAWMNKNMKMDTSGGGVGKMFGRLVSGDSMFQNVYTAVGGEGEIAFASSFPGSIKVFEVGPGNDIVLQKSAFLAAEKGVDLSVFFQKKLSSGLVGGEGFIMQRVSGNGCVFAEFDGHVVDYELNPGESMVVNTGYVAAMTSNVTMNVEMIKGVKNVLFGGEGLFNTVLTGPGHIWLQTIPVIKMAQTLVPYLPINRDK